MSVSLCGCCCPAFLLMTVASSVVTVRVSTVLMVLVSEPPGVWHSSTVLTMCVFTVLCFFCFTVLPWLPWLLSWPFIVEGLSSPGVCVSSGRVCGVGECVEWESVSSGRVCGVDYHANGFSEPACELHLSSHTAFSISLGSHGGAWPTPHGLAAGLQVWGRGMREAKTTSLHTPQMRDPQYSQ